MKGNRRVARGLTTKHGRWVFSLAGMFLWWVGASLPGSVALSATGQYTLTNLGLPPGATSAIGVRMNNAGDVAGWSAFSEAPALRGWVWTQEDGFTVLPTPPGFTRYRAMDINDSGVVAGDGGYDGGVSWRFENDAYAVLGAVDGLPISYLGGINNQGDIAGTSKGYSFTMPDRAFLAPNGKALINLTPDISGRATDVNNAGQVAGYSTSFEAFRWDETGGIQFLGSLGLAHSFGNAINEVGQVVGEALSTTGNTSKPFIFTDGVGMLQIPAPVTQSSAAFGVNSHGHVVGTTDVTGPDLAWLWTGGSSVTDLDSLFDSAAENIATLAAHDINDAGQILAFGYDNNVGEFRSLLLTPPPLPGLPGDFNGDGIIEAGDYTIWRDTMEAGGTFLPNDPTPGSVDESDYDYWRTNFGRTIESITANGASGVSADGNVPAVPEPSSCGLLVMAATAAYLRRRRRA